MIRNRDLIKTTMLLTVSMILSSVAVGCGAGTDENEVNNDTEVVAEVQTEVKETVYDEVAVGMQYSGLITKDAVLYSTSDLNGKVADLKLDEIVTVTHHLYLDGKEMDIYKVKTESGIAGYISGVDADFNRDYLEGIEPVEGGDGEEVVESTEVIEDTIENTEVAEEVFEPYIMYTNTGVNVRSQASKDSTLLGTLGINTEIRVIGEENGFSKFEFDGNIAYIKSTLLSKIKTEIKQTQSSSSSSSTDTSDSSSSSSGSSSSSESSGNSSGGGLVGLDGSTGLDVDKDADPIGDGSGGGVDDSNVTFH